MDKTNELVVVLLQLEAAADGANVVGAPVIALDRAKVAKDPELVLGLAMVPDEYFQDDVLILPVKRLDQSSQPNVQHLLLIFAKPHR